MILRLIADLVQNREDSIIVGNILHTGAIMPVTHPPLPVDDQYGRHPAKFKQVEMLPVEFQYVVPGISETNKGDLLSLPIPPEGIRAIRPDGNHLGSALDEPLVVLAQLRQMPPAVRSHETA